IRPPCTSPHGLAASGIICLDMTTRDSETVLGASSVPYLSIQKPPRLRRLGIVNQLQGPIFVGAGRCSLKPRAGNPIVSPLSRQSSRYHVTECQCDEPRFGRCRLS